MRQHNRFWRRVRRHRLAATILLAMIAACSSYAFTTSIGGISPGLVGSGTGSIGKYSLSSLVYNLNLGGNSNNITSITFTLSGASSSTSVRVQAAGTWYACSVAGSSVTCATTNPQLTATNAWSGGSGQLVMVATG
jgi:hypothetical protein